MTAYNTITTLNVIRSASPCHDGWTKLLTHLGKTKADDEPLELLTVLNSNGLDDALWVLSFAMPEDRLGRHFQAWCAEQVLPLFEERYPGDMRVRGQIAILRNDEVSAEQRTAARAAAEDAARAAAADAAADAARDAAWAAASAAARAAAWAAAIVAAIVAARDAARAAQEEQLRKMIGASDRTRPT